MTVYKKQFTFSDIPENEEYREFVEKFKAKKTTDDCYTPENIYNAVAEFVTSEYGRKRSGFVRPFWPGGDYESFDYPNGCTVVDNPPFSIVSKILEFYDRHTIPFFIFANGLTLFTANHLNRLTYICTGTNIEYQNGAKVNTGFITNMSPEICIRSCPELHDTLDTINKKNCKKTKKEKRNLKFPDAFVTAARCSWFSMHHTRFMIRRKDSVFLSELESIGKVFGGGYLLSERAAAELAAAEREAAAERAAAERAYLSERELAMQKSISMQEQEVE